MLEIKKLRKDYLTDDKPFTALSDISLSFPEVQFVAVLGPSGCGKTTLLNCIGGLDKITEGDITIDDKSLSSMSEEQLDSYRNNYIGFIFQNYYLIPQLSVLDNIKVALAVRDYSEEEINQKSLEALRKIGIEDLKDKKPNQLSGGQAQRVAIARCLVTSPKIILADEPTGALDSHTSISIMDLLKELSKDHLVIMVTHNEDLASKYADRIINLKDGRLISDVLVNKVEQENIVEEKELKKSKLSFKMSMKLVWKNLLSRKTKTILTSIANSFGIIGIGFFFAINFGFNNYSNNLSTASATSLPVVVTAYNRKSQTESFSSKNASVSYPDVDEIYPSVDTSTSYSYTYNNFTPKYMAYLNQLQEEGILREYITSYSNSYSYNLTTTYPDSLDGSSKGGLGLVNTTVTSYNYYAYSAKLPYNIFHVLYGDISQYDLITEGFTIPGTEEKSHLPTTKNEVVLVVNNYNAVSFRILQQLGFYNSQDEQEDVEDETLKSKVKPISFSDILGKEYKVFDNDELYTETSTEELKDANDYTRTIHHYTKNTLNKDFYDNHGESLKIVGIIRPKQTSPFTILSPALCYLPSLQEELMPKNEQSALATNLKDNILFHAPAGVEKVNALTSFCSEVYAVINNYFNSASNVLPTDDLNDIFNRYFYYYPYEATGYMYLGFSSFLSDAANHGATLVSDELLGRDLSEQSVLEEQMDKIIKAGMPEQGEPDYQTVYNEIISLVAYANAYSKITGIVLFPVDLPSRATLLQLLDVFNNFNDDAEQQNSSYATTDEEKVHYVASDANQLIEEVGEMITLVSTILIAFATISLLVSSAMTASLTSNNVLERKKEIGLLRSLGSRKSDVSRLFEMEAIIIGLLAGVVGSLMTFGLSFPLNVLINSASTISYYNVGNICHFTWWHALIITSISVVIGFVSALIPALKASRQNPVETLRSE
jgi:putative ABC transport system permease protein